MITCMIGGSPAVSTSSRKRLSSHTGGTWEPSGRQKIQSSLRRPARRLGEVLQVITADVAGQVLDHLRRTGFPDLSDLGG